MPNEAKCYVPVTIFTPGTTLLAAMWKRYLRRDETMSAPRLSASPDGDVQKSPTVSPVRLCPKHNNDLSTGMTEATEGPRSCWLVPLRMASARSNHLFRCSQNVILENSQPNTHTPWPLRDDLSRHWTTLSPAWVIGHRSETKHRSIKTEHLSPFLTPAQTGYIDFIPVLKAQQLDKLLGWLSTNMIR